MTEMTIFILRYYRESLKKYLIANENAVPFYEKLGMKKSTDVMQYNHIEWIEWTVE